MFSGSHFCEPASLKPLKPTRLITFNFQLSTFSFQLSSFESQE